MIIKGKSIFLQSVEVTDAQFVLDLRLSRGQYLSATSNDLANQIKWLEDYKKREEQGKEFYFTICGLDGEKMGLIRIYNLQKDNFTWGSWVIKQGSPSFAAIESIMRVHDFGFDQLHYDQSLFDVRKDNLKLVNFYQNTLKAKFLSSDDQHHYFSYDKATHLENKKKYKKFYEDSVS